MKGCLCLRPVPRDGLVSEPRDTKAAWEETFPALAAARSLAGSVLRALGPRAGTSLAPSVLSAERSRLPVSQLWAPAQAAFPRDGLSSLLSSSSKAPPLGGLPDPL